MKTDSTPLVSILIPVFNAEKYLHECLDSIVAQTYTHIEVILVDDGSTDSSLAIAKAYEHQYPFVKTYSQANAGAASARNQAFLHSRGDYIQYLDADDILHQNKIASQILKLKEFNFNQNILSTSKWGRFFNNISNTVFSEYIIFRSYTNSLLFLKDAWTNTQNMIIHSWLIPRTLHLKAGVWNEKLSVYDDNAFCSTIAYHAEKILYVSDSIVYYRQDNTESLSKNTSHEGMKSHLNVCHTFTKLVEKDLNLAGMRYALATEYSKCLYRSYPQYPDIVREAEAAIKSLGFDTPPPLPTKKFRLASKIMGFYPAARLFGFKDKMTKKIHTMRSSFHDRD